MRTTILVLVASLIFGTIGGAITNYRLVPMIMDYYGFETTMPAMTGGYATSQNEHTKIDKEVLKEEIKNYIKETYKPKSGYDTAVIQAVDKIAPAVVSIVATKDVSVVQKNPFLMDPFFRKFFNIPGENQNQFGPKTPPTQELKIGGATGFMISENGLLITNRHVVADEGASYSAILADGRAYDGEIIYRDNVFDIAIMRLTKASKNTENKAQTNSGETVQGVGASALPEFPTVSFGKSEDAKIGQTVLAIGNALTEYENSVTKGIISAKWRQISVGGGYQGAQILSGLIQTDAAINPGNSGGPLINLDGEVIGINTAMDAQAQGIGFAIAVDDIAYIVDSLKEHGKVVRPYLGVRYQTLSPAKAEAIGDKQELSGKPLIVGDVSQNIPGVLPGSPAAKAGLKSGDVILSVNGEAISPGNSLAQMVATMKPGETITLTVWRDGKTQELEVLLQEFEA